MMKGPMQLLSIAFLVLVLQHEPNNIKRNDNNGMNISRQNKRSCSSMAFAQQVTQLGLTPVSQLGQIEVQVIVEQSFEGFSFGIVDEDQTPVEVLEPTGVLLSLLLVFHRSIRVCIVLPGFINGGKFAGGLAEEAGITLMVGIEQVFGAGAEQSIDPAGGLIQTLLFVTVPTSFAGQQLCLSGAC